MTDLAALPPEMAERGVTMFSGLRTREGAHLARHFIALFEAEPPRPDTSWNDLWSIKEEEVPDRSYPERFESARFCMDQQRLLAELAPTGGHPLV